MRRTFLALLAFTVIASLAAQTTVTISSTVEQASANRFGVNIGGESNYGQSQILKDLNYANNAYMASYYWRATFSCNTGGTNDTTHWFNGAYTSSGYYPANFWVGATYNAVNSSNGTSYGTGTITASSANSSVGIQFTLGTALSSACNTTNQDQIVLTLANASPTLQTPTQGQSGGTSICSGATWDTSDTDPSSTNTVQSLEMPTGCTVTYAIDPGETNSTNTNGYGSNAPSWINLNGSYSAVFMAKCPSASGSSTLTVSAARLGGTTYISSTPETLTCNPTAGAGWQTFTINFSASETGAQNQNLQYDFTCTGTCLLQEAHMYEGSTLSGNTTPFRDAVVRKLQALNPGSLRFMDGSDWCSTVADMTGPIGNLRTCNASDYVPWAGFANPINYDTRLQLCAFMGTNCWITIGNMTTASEWTALITWLSTDASYTTIKNAGHAVYLEDCNECWNFGGSTAASGLWSGGGFTYGYFLGPNMVAAKAASGYDSTHMKLVSDDQDAAYGTFSWQQVSLTTAGCSLSTTTHCPDYADSAAYTLGYLGNFDSSGSNVSATGAPFLDEWAEITNLTQNPPISSSPPTSSFYGWNNYAVTNYGVNGSIYEANISPTQGDASPAPTQLQMNQITGSVGAALITAQDFLLMQRDAKLTGPLNIFTLPQNNFNYNNGAPYPAVWGIERYMACGPGQLSSCADVDRPTSIAFQIINNAIGSNNNLMSTTQSGTPTFSYAGGQVYPSYGNTIAANSTVPYVNCFSYANGAKTNWTTICFNNNLTTSETVTLSGTGAPTGSVQQTSFGPSNTITDNNENTFTVTSESSSPTVTIPTASSTSGTSYTIPAASFITLTYSTSGGSSGGVASSGAVVMTGNSVQQ